jgi:hypothetical protein
MNASISEIRRSERSIIVLNAVRVNRKHGADPLVGLWHHVRRAWYQIVKTRVNQEAGIVQDPTRNSIVTRQTFKVSVVSDPAPPVVREVRQGADDRVGRPCHPLRVRDSRAKANSRREKRRLAKFLHLFELRFYLPQMTRQHSLRDS